MAKITLPAKPLYAKRDQVRNLIPFTLYIKSTNDVMLQPQTHER